MESWWPRKRAGGQGLLVVEKGKQERVGCTLQESWKFSRKGCPSAMILFLLQGLMRDTLKGRRERG
eukprot:1156677-Pelagomonas_calceolata.AAC.3